MSTGYEAEYNYFFYKFALNNHINFRRFHVYFY
nr:MAG TPA: hypothetical protein [Caudoviricetes sp.]